jgi:CxxC motif-containing protein (DUF1111 family)
MCADRRFRLRAAFVLALSVMLGMSSAPAMAQAAGGLRKNDDPFGASAVNKEDSPNARVQRGRELFFNRWKKADVANPSGDWLGPAFNARSCIECHRQAGPGGSGSLDHNVDLLSVILPVPAAHDRKKLIDRIGAVDAAFTTDTTSSRPNVTLHKFGTDPAYGAWRSDVLAIVAASQAAAKHQPQPAPTVKTIASGRDAVRQKTLDKKLAAFEQGPPQSDRLQFVVTQRRTPALFGAGLIDTIPDEVLKATAKAQADKHNEIKGEVAAAIGGRAGKFGWRGQTADLKEFVMGACANELGLQVPGHNQGIDPLDPGYRSPGLDLTQEQCDDLAAFVASLPRPMQRQPKNADERDLWQSGEFVFESVGCANCHVRTLATVEGLYSDLLLHDLGPRLADPSGANPSSGPGSGTAAYYGGPADVFVKSAPITRRQWRTPPLWGVADSAPYLHDGRAATLDEAIKAHAGEATTAAHLYNALPAADREKLLAFLNSLAAPKETTRLAQD